MEIKITTKLVLKILEILSWILFAGLSVEAGAIIVNTFITLAINPQGVENFWEGKDYLPALLRHDSGHFFAVTFIMIIVAVLKAIMFYVILKFLAEKKLNMSQPFSRELRRFIATLAWLALGIGLFSSYGYDYTKWLSKQGLALPNLQSLHIAGSDVWLFMAVILFVIAQVVKRGIEIQEENSLTI